MAVCTAWAGLVTTTGGGEDQTAGTQEVTVEQRIALVLFYGVMGAVVATCVANWPGIVWSSAWVEAAATWFSGLGSFAAVAAALYIAGSHERQRISERKEEYSKRRKLAVFRLLRKSSDYRLAMWTAIAGYENGEFHNIVTWERSAVTEKLTQGINIEPFDPIEELVFIHEVSIQVVILEGNLRAYLAACDRLPLAHGRDITRCVSDAVHYARLVSSDAGLLITFAERCLQTE